MPTEEEIINEVLKYDPERQRKAEEVDPAVIEEILNYDPEIARIGGTFQPKLSPFPGGGTPISTITGKPETEYVPGEQPSAGFGPMIKAGFVDDPRKQIEIYAKARGIPTSRYKIHNGEIIFRDQNGKWQRETGELPLSLLKRGAVQTVTNPAVIGGTAGAILGGPKGAMLGAAGGEGIRKAIGSLAFGEEQTSLGNLGDMALEAALAGTGEAIGKGIGRVIRRIKLGGKPTQYAGTEVVQGILTAEDHAKAELIREIARRNGIELAPHQLYDKKGMTNIWMYLREHPATSDAIRTFEDNLANQTDEAIGRFVRDMGGYEETPFFVGQKLQEAAAKSIESAKEVRRIAASPLYQKAFKTAPEVDIKPVIEYIDTELATAKGEIRNQLLRAKKILEKPDLPKGFLPSGFPIQELERMEKGPKTFRAYVKSLGGIASDDVSYHGEIKDISKKAKWQPGVIVSRRKGGNPMDELLAKIKEGGEWKGIIENENDVLEALANNPSKSSVTERLSERELQAAELEEIERKYGTSATRYIQERWDTSLQGLHGSKIEFDRIIENARQDSLGNTVKRHYQVIKDALLTQMDAASPEYAAARQRFAELSEPVEALKKSVIGELDKMTKESAIGKAPHKLLDVANMPDAQLLITARRSIEPQDPKLWKQMVGSYIRDVYEGLKIAQTEGKIINPAGKLYQKLFGSQKQREIMQAALTNDEFEALSDLMKVFQRASIGTARQSMTAPFQQIEKQIVSPMQSKIKAFLEHPKQVSIDWVLGRWSDFLMRGRQGALLDVLTSPESLEQIRKLKPMTPGSQKLIDGLAVYMTLIAPKIGLEDIGSRLPGEQ